MTKTHKLVSAAVIAAAMLATPAMAREGHVARHVAANANASTGSYVDGRACVRAPAVGAFATQPWNNAPPCEPSTAY
jgi:hypothetical protein